MLIQKINQKSSRYPSNALIFQQKNNFKIILLCISYCFTPKDCKNVTTNLIFDKRVKFFLKKRKNLNHGSFSHMFISYLPLSKNINLRREAFNTFLNGIFVLTSVYDFKKIKKRILAPRYYVVVSKHVDLEFL